MKTGTKSKLHLLVIIAIAIALLPLAAYGETTYDESTPLEELKTAADGGNSEAMLEYGSRLLQGQGVDSNAVDGLAWINKAAEAGNTEAWYGLGVIYCNGLGVETDWPKSIEYLRKGAELGNANCQTSLGMFYQAGDRIPSGLKADMAEAAKWYRMAAEQDHTEAIQHLAMMTVGGQGVEQDDKAAMELFHKGAELGNADCFWGLGQCYLEGRGVAVDSVMAYALWSASLDGIGFPRQKEAMTAKRDELGKLLSSDQLAKAEPITAQWKSKLASEQ